MRTVSETELFGVEDYKVAIQKEETQNFPLMAMPRRNSQIILSDSDMNSSEGMPLEVSNTRIDGIEADSLRKQVLFLIISFFLSSSSSSSETEKSMLWLIEFAYFV